MLGKLLVAPASHHSDYWAETAILIYDETPSSISGLILNKHTLKSVTDLAKHHNLQYTGNEMLYLGGPVNMSALILLHTGDWRGTNTLSVGNTDYYITSDKTMLKRLCAGDTPKQWKLFLGMSVWTPHQLEGEIEGVPPWSKKSAWLITEPSDQVVFESKQRQSWNSAIDSVAHTMVDNYFSID